MKLPWWTKSWTVWVAVAGFAACSIPYTRKFLHQGELGAIQFQAILHALLRFKTETRATKLSAVNGKEEG